MLFKNKKSAGTTFEAKCNILAELWLNHRDDEEFTDFCEYNDLGLPLAYLLANDIVGTTEQATKFVDETFELLLSGLNLEDSGFEVLADLIGEDEVDQDDEDEEESSPSRSGAKFCANCGGRHEAGSEKFCANCGAART
jgi:hypothetical protein